MKQISIIEAVAECICEPDGTHGLEGYLLKDTYHAEEVIVGEKHHYRIYPDTDQPTYYETCSKRVFDKYFQITQYLEQRELARGDNLNTHKSEPKPLTAVCQICEINADLLEACKELVSQFSEVLKELQNNPDHAVEIVHKFGITAQNHAGLNKARAVIAKAEAK